MTINTRQDFLDQFDAINQIINSNHNFISNEPNPSKKRSAMRQINTVKGYEIEQIRIKLSKGENVTEDEVATLRKELSQYYASRHRNNVAARFFLNFLPAVITGPVFHAFYWIIDIIVVAVAVKANKKSTTTKSSSVGLYESTSSVDELSSNKSAKFRWDWTKAIPSIGNSFSTLKDIKSFLDDTEELDVNILNVEQKNDSVPNDDESVENSLKDKQRKKERENTTSVAQVKQGELDLVKGVTARLRAKLGKTEAEKQKAANKVLFNPAIIVPAMLEEVKLQQLQPIKAQGFLDAAKLYVQPVVTAFENLVAPKANPAVAVKPELSIVPVSNVSSGQIVQFPFAQSQKQASFSEAIKKPFVNAWEFLTNPSKLIAQTVSMVRLLKKPVAPVQSFAIVDAKAVTQPVKAVEQVEFVEHTYTGTINGNELIDLKLFVTIIGQEKFVDASIYNAEGILLGKYTSAEGIRAAFPTINFDVEIERNLLSIVASASDGQLENVVSEKSKLVVLADDVQEELAVVVAEPTTPTKAVTPLERFIAGLSEVVVTVKNKLSPQKQVSTQATPNADANLLSPNNLTGLPVERVRMDDADVNYANEAVNNPSYVVDMDKLDDDSSSVAILKALSPVGVVVLDDSGYVVRQAGDVDVALDFGNSGEVSDDLDPFAPFLKDTSMSSAAFTPVFKSGTGTTGNPFVEEVTVEAKKGDLSLQMDDDRQSTDPEIF